MARILLGLTVFLGFFSIQAETRVLPSAAEQLSLYQDLYHEGYINQREFNFHKNNVRELKSNKTTQSIKLGTASISGQVFLGAGTVAAKGVLLFDSNWGFIDSAVTDGAGNYVFASLGAGDYYVAIQDINDGFVDVIWTATGTEFCQYCELPANSTITLALAEARVGVNLHLSMGATLSGQMTDAVTSRRLSENSEPTAAKLNLAIFPPNFR